MVRKLLPTAILALSASAHAWDTNAHKIIGVIAYRHLTPQAKAWCDAALRTMPAGYQDFLNAAPYPDYLKHGSPKDKPPIQRSHKFDDWHYIDYPIRPGQTATIPFDTSLEGNGDNALYGLAASVRNLQRGLPSARGLYLAMILHVVGDLHQPLHCADRNDKGGNDFRLKGSPNNLHALWDDAITKEYRLSGKRRKTDEAIVAAANDLERRLPMSALASEIAVTDPPRWAYESYALAVNAYNGVRPGTRPTTNYKALVQSVADHRVVLAGYRLATFLNRLVAGQVKA